MANPSLKELFVKCQDAHNQHELLKLFYKLYKAMDKEEFLQEFLSLVRHPMCIFAREVNVEKTIDFISKAISHVAIKDDKETEVAGLDEDPDMHPLMFGFFTFLLDHHSGHDRAVRFRCCQLITKLLKDMGDNAKIDDDLYDRIYKCMVERLRDKCAQVRVHAVLSLTRLQDPTDETCPIVKAYMILMAKDPNMEVRRIILKCIAPSTNSLGPILERTRDAKEAVRRTAYSVIADKIPLRALTIEQRIELIQGGLNDRSEPVQTICSDKLLQVWLRSCQGNVLEFLERLDVQTSVKTCEKALGVIFKSSALIELVTGFDILDENQLIPEEKLSCESAYYWRTMVEYVQGQGHEYDEQLDRIRPNCIMFCSYISKFTEQLKDCSDVDKMIDLEFTAEQLLKILQFMDISDTSSRKETKRLLHDLMVCEHVGPTLVQHLLPCLKLVQPDVEKLVTLVAEAISDIREPITRKEMTLTGEQRMTIDKKIAGIRVKVNELRHELSDCIENQDFEKAAKLKADISGLDAERSSLMEESQPQIEEVRTVRDDPMTILKCLTIVSELLVSADVKKWYPQLQAMLESQILTSMVTTAAEVRNAAVKAIGLCCHVNKNIIMQHLPLLLQAAQIDTPAVRVTALRAIFDIICIFGLDCFTEDTDHQASTNRDGQTGDDQEDVEEESNKTTEVSTADNSSVVQESFFEAKKKMVDETDKVGWTETASKVISILSTFLNSEVTELRSIAAQGLCKLIMAGRIVSAKLLSHLVLLWFNPLTEEDEQLSQELGAFFPLFAFSSSDNQQLVEEAFLPTLKLLSRAPASSPLIEVNEVHVANFLVELTDARHLAENVKANTIVQENPCHDSLAVKLCNEILSHPDSFTVKLWLRTLTQISVSPNKASLLKDLIKMAEEMAMVVTEKQCLKLLERFRESIGDLNESADEESNADEPKEMESASMETQGGEAVADAATVPAKKATRRSVKTPSVSKTPSAAAGGRSTARRAAYQKTINESVFQEFATPKPKGGRQKDDVEGTREDLENLLLEYRASKTPVVPNTPKTPKRPLHSIQDPAFTEDV